ncbi:MAG: putative toxin-antitoxin system toxin component, PIN family [Chloroflexota bacterium]
MRLVFDTNVIVSALLFEESTPGKAFFGALRKGVVLTSDDTYLELSEVIRRKKFDRYISRIERERFLLVFLRTAALVEVTEIISACRDPKDDKFLELAVNGQADIVISGDDDLLLLNPFRGIVIITPGEFLTRR